MQSRPSRYWIGLLLLILLAVPLGIASAGDNNINWNELRHDSRDPLYRNPQGAAPTGTAVKLRLRALDGDLTGAQLRVYNDRSNSETFYPMQPAATNVMFTGDPTAYEFWEATIPAISAPTILYYRFIATDGTATAFYEDDNQFTGGVGAVYGSSPDYSWGLTYYDPAFTTPDWVKNATIYQIFVDRFRNGDPTNDLPAGEFFYGEGTTIQRSNTANWNARICDPRSELTLNCAGYYSQNFYGGDLQGVIDQVDYLDNLGVTAVYLNPIFESPSNHKYDTRDFMQIDDNFGTLATFQALATELHNRGMYLILDGVFNHMSSDSPAFDRYARYGTTGACESSASPFVSWFYFTSGTAPTQCAENRNYTSWFGYDSLPKLRAGETQVRDYFINNGTASVGPYWMQWADGWRLDVGGDIDPGQINDPANDYWEDFRTAVRAVNPETYIVGEEWNNAVSWTVGGEWDATMNYPMGTAAMGLWRDTDFIDNDPNISPQALTPTAFNERVLHLRERYAPEAFDAMMNLLDSHDTNRALFKLDANTGANNDALYENPAYDWNPALRSLAGTFVVHMTLPGAPTIYYGDEVGTINPPAFANGKWEDDPYNRVPFPWLDETGTPYYNHMANPTAQGAIRNYLTLLTAARNNHEALRTGEYIPLLTNDVDRALAYLRWMPNDSDAGVVVVNRQNTTQVVTVDVSGYLSAGLSLTNVLNSSNVVVAADGTLSVTLFANSSALLVTTAPQPGRPGVVTNLASDIGAGQLVLTWTASANATDYQIYRSRLSGGGYQLVGTTDVATYTDTGLTNATPYYYVVVAMNDASLLESAWSAEVVGVPGYDLGNECCSWYNLQYPPTIDNHVLGALNETVTIYGQIWIQGATDTSSTPVPNVRAQVGYGVAATDPASWTWFEMIHNSGYDFSQNNDEFQGELLPTEVGTFAYTTRYSTDNGLTWFYGDLNGRPYSADQAGVLTVIEPTDQDAPEAVTGLEVTGSTAVSITLGWDAHPDTDGDLYGFRVYRQLHIDSITAAAFEQIAQINDADAISYTDSTVTAGEEYDYYVTALDTSFNESDPSNTATGSAIARNVAVTFTVTVPAGTPGTVHIAGDFGPNYPTWNPGAIPMTQVNATTWAITLTVLDGQGMQYKYTRGSWETVEKDADGNELASNRMATASYGTTGLQNVANTVATWRDPYVISVTPASAATGVAVDSAITVTFSEPMNAGSITTAGRFTLMQGITAVAGVVTTPTENTAVFTPDVPLAADATYSVSITGTSDTDGDSQQANFSSTFMTAVASNPNLLQNADFDDTNLAPWFVSGQITYSVSNGAITFNRQAGSITAGVHQYSGTAFTAGESIQAMIVIANTSPVRKRVSLIAHDSNWTDLELCTFWLAPNTPATTYSLGFMTNTAWANASLSIYESTRDGSGSLVVESAMLRRNLGTPYTHTFCAGGAPLGAGVGADSANLLTNGDFSSGSLAPWFQWGQIVGGINGGAYDFYRTLNGDQAAIVQESNAVTAAPIRMEARVDIGNTSGVRKRVVLIIHDEDWSDLAACSFYLAAGTPLTTLGIQLVTTEAWQGATFSLYEGTRDGAAAISVDNAALRVRPTLTNIGTQCYGLGDVLPPLPLTTDVITPIVEIAPVVETLPLDALPTPADAKQDDVPLLEGAPGEAEG